MFLVSAATTKQQRGAALVLALLILSIVVILAATLASDSLLALRRVENQIYSQQAYAYLRGAEVMAREVLQTDFDLSNKKDHFSEQWLETDQEFQLREGVIRGRLSDLQGRFNLNNLVDQPVAGQRFSVNQQRFIRLLKALPLEEPLDQLQAEDLTRSVVDWIDSNDEIRPEGGAESSYYSGLELPFRSGNQLLHSASELMWVKDMTPAIFYALRPHITALPEASDINVNTASAQVLQALVAEEAGGEGEEMLYRRDGDINSPSQGFETIEEFNQVYTDIAGSTTGNNPLTGVQVRSDYFLLSAQVLFLEREFRLQSVLHRDSAGKTRVIARSYGDI